MLYPAKPTNSAFASIENIAIFSGQAGQAGQSWTAGQILDKSSKPDKLNKLVMFCNTQLAGLADYRDVMGDMWM